MIVSPSPSVSFLRPGSSSVAMNSSEEFFLTLLSRLLQCSDKSNTEDTPKTRPETDDRFARPFSPAHPIECKGKESHAVLHSIECDGVDGPANQLDSGAPAMSRLLIYSWYSLPDLKPEQKHFISISSLNVPEMRPLHTF